MIKHYTTVDLLKMLGIPKHRLDYLVEMGRAPTPKRFGDAPNSPKMWSDYDVVVLKAVLEMQGDKWKRRKKKETEK